MICRNWSNGLRIAVLFFAVSIIAASCSIHTDTKRTQSQRFQTISISDRQNRIRLEHVAINVEDPVAMAEWYCENLDMKIIRKGEPPVNMHFISDSGGNMMLEIYNNPPERYRIIAQWTHCRFISPLWLTTSSQSPGS